MNHLKFIRIFLLVLIIIGLGLIAAQKIWVPKVVDLILKNEARYSIKEVPGDTLDNIKTTDQKPDSFESCIALGGENITPGFNAPGKCVFDNSVYESKCVQNDNYFVVSKDHTGSVGTDILIKHKSSPEQKYNCNYVASQDDFEIKDNEIAQYVLAIDNNFLMVDVGTAPYPRGLMIYNMSTGRMIFSGLYSGINNIKDNKIDYWTETTEKATAQNCPDFSKYEKNGPGSEAIEARIILYLATLVKTDSGERRCRGRM